MYFIALNLMCKINLIVELEERETIPNIGMLII